MPVKRLMGGLFEFALAAVLAAIIIYATYRIFIAANPDFDMEEEIRKGNTAVGALVASILVAASLILKDGMAAVVNLVRLRLAAPADIGFSAWRLLLIGLGHLALSLSLALLTVSVSLRVFGRLSRARGWRPGEELKRGNIAVGVILGAVVLVASLYVAQGVGALTKALSPQPAVAAVQIAR